MTERRAELEQSFSDGMELLKPERSPAEWKQGIALIEAASDAGLGQASEQRAIFECMGVGRPSNWEKALDCLALAAEQGSLRARDQLLLLAGADEAGSGGPGCWNGLRTQVSIDQLLSCPAVELVSVSPRIGIIAGFASAAECRWLIDSAADRLAPSSIYDFQTGTQRPDPKRTNRGTQCNPFDVGIVAEVIRARLSRAIGLPLAHYEISQILHYTVGQEFKPHHDYFDPDKEGFRHEIATLGQRVATQLIFLNEEFEGGETEFPSIGLSYRGATGDALMFFNINEAGEPEPLTLHAGLPPTAGEKWIFSQWVRDRRPQPAS